MDGRTMVRKKNRKREFELIVFITVMYSRTEMTRTIGTKCQSSSKFFTSYLQEKREEKTVSFCKVRLFCDLDSEPLCKDIKDLLSPIDKICVLFLSLDCHSLFSEHKRTVKAFRDVSIDRRRIRAYQKERNMG